MTCHYCGAPDTIANSHVMPKFMARYLKKNSATGRLLNSWSRREHDDIWTGPYLCAQCDNVTFSQWENHFSKTVWPAPASATSAWGEPETIRFLTSLAFRFAIHAGETSPIASNRAYNDYFRDLARSALLNPGNVGSQLFIYPYVYQPILEGCSFLPGTNHLLTCALSGRALPKEDDLPNAYLVLFPRVLLLFCDGDLNAAASSRIHPAVSLSLGSPFHAGSNSAMPGLLATVLNGMVGQGQANQKSIGRWKRALFALDRAMYPHRACYLAAQEDLNLREWQRQHCKA